MWRKFLQFVMDHRPTKAYVVKGHGLLFYRSHLFTVGGWVVYLHHYLQGDPDERGLHDHPARNWSLVLAGGYREHRIMGYGRFGPVYQSRKRNPGSLRYVSERVFHRLEIEPPASSWSLFASKYVPGKAWGFMDAMARPNVSDLVDGASAMLYREAGPGIDDDPWWTTAPRGKEVCSDHPTPANAGVHRQAESEGDAVRTGFGGTQLDRTGIQRRPGE